MSSNVLAKKGPRALILTLALSCLGCGLTGGGKGSQGSGTPEFAPPVPTTFQLSNGIAVWHFPSTGVPLVQLGLYLRHAGSAADPQGQAGLASLTFSMLDEGAGDRGALDLADEIDFLGAELAISTDRDHAAIELEVLERNLDAGLDLFADVIQRPRFEAQEWERIKTLALNGLTQRRDQPTLVARLVADRLFYGDGHPYAAPLAGFESTVGSIELEDAKRFYAERVGPKQAVFVCVGDVAAEDLRRKLDVRFQNWRFRNWAAPGKTAPQQDAKPAPSTFEKARLVIVDKPDAPQTVLRVQMPGPSLFVPQRAPLVLANTAFGGMFTSRLSENLRKKNAFTYGAGSALAPRFEASYLVAQSSVYTTKTVPALVELCKEFRAMGSGDGLRPEEFKKARATHRIRVMKALETQQGILGYLAPSAAGGQEADERQQAYERIRAQTPESVADECARVFRWDQALVVLVGDEKAIRAQLAEHAASGNSSDCAFPQPIVVDADGIPVAPGN